MKQTIFLAVLLLSSFSFSQKILDKIENGDLKYVQKWIDKGVDLDMTYEQTNEEGTTLAFHPMTWAAVKNQREVLELFFEYKDQFDDYQKWLTQALGASIQHGDLSIIQPMIVDGADVNASCNSCRGAVPIAIAVAYRHYDVMEYLLEMGAKMQNPGSRYDVIHVAVKTDSLEFVKDLVDNFELDLNRKSGQGKYPIHYALEMGNTDILNYMVSKGVDVSKKSDDGFNSLYYVSDYTTFKWVEKQIGDIKDLLKSSNSIIQSVVESDDKQLFNYFIERYPNEIHRLSEDGSNAYFGLLFTTENTEHFYKNLKTRNVEVVENNEGESVQDYAKWMKKKKLKKILKIQYEPIQ
jgi:ankyrin repeat protein